MKISSAQKSFWQHVVAYLWMLLGTFLVATALEVFLIPSRLIDGGIIGLSMILSYVLGQTLLPYILLILSVPFVIVAYKQIGKRFVIQMVSALIMLSIWIFILHYAPAFEGDVLEVIVFGGLMLGIGGGLIIRVGGALDGTEIMAILLSKRRGYTVGQVVFFFNIFIFALSGFVYQDWHPALRSFMTYIIAYKMMDTVIVGLDETKAAWIISTRPQQLAELLVHKLGLGVTIMQGRGGYSGGAQEMLYVVVERLQLAELKQMVIREDPNAFVAIENLHEVIGGQTDGQKKRLKKRKKRRQKS